ncbi:LOW QUALITY PROTEIN: hypothetical protein V2J09_019070 [Rumex salicifolius]
MKGKKSAKINDQHQNGHLTPFKLANLFDPDASWDKDQLGDVLHWIRQVVGLMCGLLWGAIPLVGGMWFFVFLAISTGIVYGYYAMILNVDEEEFGGHGALLQEGLFASVTLFLAIVDVVTTIVTDPKTRSLAWLGFLDASPFSLSKKIPFLAPPLTCKLFYNSVIYTLPSMNKLRTSEIFWLLVHNGDVRPLDVTLIVDGRQVLRLISSVWLHAGVFHILANMLSLVFIGLRLEQEFGHGSSISVGASGALFGLLGAMLSELITNRTLYDNKFATFLTLIVGGFISDFLLGFLVADQFELIMLLHGVNANDHCSWCHYMSCIHTSNSKRLCQVINFCFAHQNPFVRAHLILVVILDIFAMTYNFGIYCSLSNLDWNSI